MKIRATFVGGLVIVLLALIVTAIIHGYFRSNLQTRALPNGKKQIVLIAADDHPEGYPTVQAIHYMGKILRQESHNTMTIRVYAGAQLGDEENSLEQTLFGAINIDRVTADTLANVAPETIPLSLPYMFKSVPMMHKIVDGPIGDEILASLKTDGYVGLGFYDSGARSFYNTKKPLYTPTDIKGLKIRVQASDVAVAMIKALGANPVAMDFGEVFNALKLGDVDGAENNIPSFYTTNHYTIARYYSEDQHMISPEILLMSEHTMRELTPQQQQWVKIAAKRSIPYMRQQWQKLRQQGLQRMQAAGVKFNTVNIEAWRNKVLSIYPQFITTQRLKRLVAEINAAQRTP